MKRTESLSTPAESSSEAMRKVPGNTEFAKLLVSVVMPAIKGVPISTGNLPAARMSGISDRMSKSSSQVEDTSVSLNTSS